MNCFFIDIDGTLMFDGHVPQRNIDAIKKARQRGCRVFLCTGRSVAFIPEEVLNIEVDGGVYGIGSYVTVDGKTIYHNPIPKENALLLIEMFLKSRKSILLEGIYDVYALNREDLPDKKIFGVYDFLKKCAKDEISKFTCAALDARETEILSGKFAVNNFGTYSEGSNAGTCKKNGIRLLAEHLGLKREDLTGIGDSINDLGMFEICGKSAAMGNAPDEVKNAASYVTCHSADGGVADAIELFI